MKHILNLLLLLIAGLLNAQQHSPKTAVESYLEYYKAGDTTGLKTVFHEDFQLTYISPWEQGAKAYKKVNRAEMFGFFNAHWKELNISGTYSELSVTGNIAQAKAIVRLEGIVEWTDYITLIQMEGKWWIIAKSSTGELLEED